MTVTGPDDLERCPWGNDPALRRYHDDEWGRELRGDRAVFERLSLEGFQSGLSWSLILRKREAFRAAFVGFVPALVSRFDESDVERLLADAAIVRNRAKIEATISNARATLELGESLSDLVWSFAPGAHVAPRAVEDIPASTAESTALARELKARGFRFIGPTTAYALMQATGMVDDHLVGCAARRS